MVRFTALYPAAPGAEFDHGYYETTNRNLVHRLFAPYGLVRIEFERGEGTPGAPAPFLAVGHLYFHSADDMQAGLAAHVQSAIDDLPRFPNIQPLIQIGRIGTMINVASETRSPA